MYRVFGSGSTHKPHAYFMQHSKMHNKGRRVNLIRASDTRFAGYFYAMHRQLRCRKALEATVYSAAWNGLKQLKLIVHRAVIDVKEDLFWKRMFILLRALFPLLKLLRLADSNKPNMDKVCYLLNKARLHLVKSKDNLMNEVLFPPNFRIRSQDEADAIYDSNERDDDNDDDDGEVLGDFTDADEDVYEKEDQWGTLYTDDSKGIFSKVAAAVSDQSPKVTHDFAVTAWVCSIHPDIVEDVKDRMTGFHRNAIERSLRQLLSYEVDDEEDREVNWKVDLFWDELKQFQNRYVN